MILCDDVKYYFKKNKEIFLIFLTLFASFIYFDKSALKNKGSFKKILIRELYGTYTTYGTYTPTHLYGTYTFNLPTNVYFKMTWLVRELSENLLV